MRATSKRRRDPVDALQRWFQAAVVHPAGAEAAADDRRVRRLLPDGARRLEDGLLPSRVMTARERLDVYASSYFLRLRDVMKVDFPGVAHALGARGFDAMMQEFVARHPSTSFTLNDFGAAMAKFLARECRVPAVVRRRGFLADLATLERAVEDVFHAPRAEAVDVERLRSIPLERWHAATFELIPAHRLLELDWPVDPYLQAVLEERRPAPVRPKTNWIVVYRKEWRSWRARLERPQFELLQLLARGRPLGAALQRVSTRHRHDAERMLAHLSQWFAEWTREGLFRSIRVP